MSHTTAPNPAKDVVGNQPGNDTIKAEREVLLNAYATMQRRLDRYRQVSMLIATAFIPIITFVMSLGFQYILNLHPTFKLSFLVFFAASATLFTYFLDKANESFREIGALIQRFEKHLSMHHANVFGSCPLLFPAPFRPQVQADRQGKTPSDERPPGWHDPFIQYAYHGVFALALIAYGTLVVRFLFPNGWPETLRLDPVLLLLYLAPALLLPAPWVYRKARNLRTKTGSLQAQNTHCECGIESHCPHLAPTSASTT